MRSSACFRQLVCATVSDLRLFALPKLFVHIIYDFFGQYTYFCCGMAADEASDTGSDAGDADFFADKDGVQPGTGISSTLHIVTNKVITDFCTWNVCAKQFVTCETETVLCRMQALQANYQWQQTTTANSRFMAIVAVKPARTGTRNNRDTLTHAICTGLPIFLSSNVLYLPDTFFQLLLVLFLGLTSIIVRFFCIVVMHYSCWLFVTEVSK